jgi:hypothetical protein
MYLGIVEDHLIIHDKSVPQNVKGRSIETPHAQRDDKIQRHIQDHLHRHYSLIAEKVSHFIKDKEITAIILGGHKK